MILATVTPVVLDEADWRERAAAHRARVDPWVTARLDRRARGAYHPVDDFLFDYYMFRPGQLRRWHPGYGVVLIGGDREWLSDKDYAATDAGVTASPQALRQRAPRLASAADLLRRTASRPPRFTCFGLHEWAMVYRADPDAIRHAGVPLRVTAAEVDRVVEAGPLRCSHVDAYRFFTPEALPRNEKVLTRATQPDDEQPGCLHATMDLYRWAFTASPFVASDLVADCFDLARAARDVDMRASPYDLRDAGYDPIRVETPDGRAEYAALQRGLAERGAVLRTALLARLEWLLDRAGERIT